MHRHFFIKQVHLCLHSFNFKCHLADGLRTSFKPQIHTVIPCRFVQTCRVDTVTGGVPVSTFVSLCTFVAAMIPVSGRELFSVVIGPVISFSTT